MSILGIGLGMMQGHQNERRNYRNEQNLANQQYGNQRMLNKQGHDLQMDMWNKTNYGAQVKHMIDAGLNPALMYGSAGQGGTTGSQGGGSASKGNSQMNKGTDPNAMLLGAQIDSMKAKAELDRANADAVGGYKKDESGALQDKLSAEELNTIQKTTNLKTDNEVREVEKEILALKAKKKVTGSAFIDMLTAVGLDPVNSEKDRDALVKILSVYFGSGVVKNILQGIGAVGKVGASKAIGGKKGMDAGKTFNDNQKRQIIDLINGN